MFLRGTGCDEMYTPIVIKESENQTPLSDAIYVNVKKLIPKDFLECIDRGPNPSYDLRVRAINADTDIGRY